MATEFHEHKLKYLKEEHEMKMKILSVELEVKMKESKMQWSHYTSSEFFKKFIISYCMTL